MPMPQRLAQFQQFLRQVWRLSAPYFSASDERWRARGLLTAIVVLNLGAVYMLVQINEWNRVFYDALQNKDAAVFWTQLGRFTLLAMAFVVIAVYRFYLTQLLQLRWRAWMTRDLMGRWLQGQAFYRMELARYAGAAVPTTGATGLPHPGQREPDNPDQRLQEDVNLFTAQTVGLSMGLLNAVVTLASFVGILWGLSGAFSFTLGERTIELPGFMVWLALLYCIAGSVLTHYIGRPLIGLNFEQQKREADFRHHLVRVREYSEAIALDRGERLHPPAGQLPAPDRQAEAAGWLHQPVRSGGGGVPVHRRRAALFFRRHPAGRADADRQRLRPRAGRAVLVRRKLRQPGQLARHHRAPDQLRSRDFKAKYGRRAHPASASSY